jgi:hypothetical protein
MALRDKPQEKIMKGEGRGEGILVPIFLGLENNIFLRKKVENSSSSGECLVVALPNIGCSAEFPQHCLSNPCLSSYIKYVCCHTHRVFVPIHTIRLSPSP